MKFVLIVFSALLFSTQQSLFKRFQIKNNRDKVRYMQFLLHVYSVSFLFAGFQYLSSGKALVVESVFFGAGFGLFFALSVIMVISAMEVIPLPFISIMASMGIILPIILGSLLYAEKIKLVHFLGLLFLFLTFYLINKKNKIEIRSPKKTFLFSLCLFLSNGVALCVLKIHQMNFGNENDLLFTFAGFCVTIMSLSIAYALVFRRKSVQAFHGMPRRNLVLLGILCGTIALTGNRINFNLAAVIPAVILFPLVNGLLVLFSTLYSRFVFKESMSVHQKIGLVTGVVSIILFAN